MESEQFISSAEAFFEALQALIMCIAISWGFLFLGCAWINVAIGEEEAQEQVFPPANWSKFNWNSSQTQFNFHTNFNFQLLKAYKRQKFLYFIPHRVKNDGKIVCGLDICERSVKFLKKQTQKRVQAGDD